MTTHDFRKLRRPDGRRARGFSLLEYTVALVLLGWGMLGLAALRMNVMHADRAGEPGAVTVAAVGAEQAIEPCDRPGTRTARELDCWSNLVTQMRPLAHVPVPPRRSGTVQPVRHRVQVGSETVPVLVYGGDVYGEGDEARGLYIVDARDGTLVWKAVPGPRAGYRAEQRGYHHAALRDPIGGSLAVLDADNDGFADRIYAGDAGGVLWRADLSALADHDDDPYTPPRAVGNRPELWRLRPLLSVGRRAPGQDGDPREHRGFAAAPEVVQSFDEHGRFDAVALGTGDLEQPADTGVEHWFYLYKDRAVKPGEEPLPALAARDLADLSDNCLQRARCAFEPDLSRGWRIRLTSRGEKMQDAPVVAEDAVFFTTYTPSATGSGRDLLYAVSLSDGTRPFEVEVPNELGGDQLRVVKVLSGDEIGAPGAGKPSTARVLAANTAPTAWWQSGAAWTNGELWSRHPAPFLPHSPGGYGWPRLRAPWHPPGLFVPWMAPPRFAQPPMALGPAAWARPWPAPPWLAVPRG